MSNHNRVSALFRGLFSKIFKSKTSIPEPENISEWSFDAEEITVKKIDFESAVLENLSKNEIIENYQKVKIKNESLIKEYENAFNSYLNGKATVNQIKMVKNEMEKAKAKEERLKSYLKAIRRDQTEERVRFREIEDNLNDKINSLIESNDHLTSENQKLSARIGDLVFENKENEHELYIKCRELIEVMGYCNKLVETVSKTDEDSRQQAVEDIASIKVELQ